MEERRQGEGGATLSVDDVIITDELARRPSRRPDYAAENRALVGLSEGLTTDPEGTLQRVAELVLRLCHADSAGISVLEAEGGEEVFRWRAAAGRFAHNLHGTMPRSASPCGTVLSRNRVLLFNEAERVFPALRNVEPRICENLLAPWVVNGEAGGTVWAIKHTREGRFDAEDARLLASLARFAGAAYSFVERTRQATAERRAALNLMEDAISARREAEQAYAALRESEEKYRTLFDSIDEGFAIVEMVYDDGGNIADMIYRQVNRAFERQGGVHDVVGRSIFEVLPGVEDYWLDLYRQVAKTGEPARVENYQRDVDRWFDVYFSRVDDDGRFVATVFNDITQRKRAEWVLRASEERQRFLVRLADALRPLADPVEVQSEAARVLGEHLGAGRAAYAEIEADGAHFTVHRDYTDGVPSFAGRHPLDSYGPEFWADLRAGRTISVADAERDARIGEAERAPYAAGMVRAAVGVPLVKGGRLAAVFFLHFPVPHEWTADEVALVEETAERTWAAVERARAEEALRASEEKYRALFDSIDEGFCIIEMIFDGEGRPVDFRYVEANEGFARQTGRRPAPGQTMRGLFPEAEDMWLDTYAEVLRTGRPRRFVDYNEGLDRWYDVYAFPTSAPKEGMQLAALFSDVTDKKRAEEAMRESEARLQKALSVETVGVIFFNEEGRFTGSNEAFTGMSGYTRGEMSAGVLGWQDLTPPEWMGRSREAVAELKATGRISPYEKEYYRKDGSRFWGLFAGSKISEGETVEYVVDVTSRKQAEEQLRASEERMRQLNEQLEGRVRERTMELAEANVSLQQEVRDRAAAEGRVRELLRQLVTVQEEERRRLARELHDTLGQQLSALRLGLALFRSQPDAGPGVGEEAERMQKIFDRLDSDIDFLAWELRPAELDQLGLDSALRSFVREWSEHFGVPAEYHGFSLEGVRLPPEVETNLYRILQEALQNVHKHAGATHVSVQLDRRGGQVALVVEDDGRGFDPEVGEAEGDRGMGLVNMRERAALVSGSLEIESGPGAGTTLYVRVPAGGDGRKGEA